MRDPQGKGMIGDWPIRPSRGSTFRAHAPVVEMRPSAGQANRKGRWPLQRHESQSRCKTILGWTVVGRWQTTSELRSSARRPEWARGSSSRSETRCQEQPVPRQRWGCVRSSLSSWFSIYACISLPLRRASICGHPRFGSVEPNHLRPDGRQGADPALQCGHEKGPAGHQGAAFSSLSDAFLTLAAKAYFGVAPAAAHPCVGQGRRWIVRGVMDEARGST